MIKIYTKEEFAYILNIANDTTVEMIDELVKNYSYEEKINGTAMMEINQLLEVFEQIVINGVTNASIDGFDVDEATQYVISDLIQRYVYASIQLNNRLTKYN